MSPIAKVDEFIEGEGFHGKVIKVEYFPKEANELTCNTVRLHLEDYFKFNGF